MSETKSDAMIAATTARTAAIRLVSYAAFLWLLQLIFVHNHAPLAFVMIGATAFTLCHTLLDRFLPQQSTEMQEAAPARFNRNDIRRGITIAIGVAIGSSLSHLRHDHAPTPIWEWTASISCSLMGGFIGGYGIHNWIRAFSGVRRDAQA